jgi:hypothetical protein
MRVGSVVDSAVNSETTLVEGAALLLRQGTSVMLFGRRRSDERAFYFLGPATYVRHESELPMSITWRLHHPLPGDLFAAFAAAVA